MDEAKASEIAKRNDEFRCSRNGLMVTRGVQALDDLQALLRAVRRFDTFTEDNDPYGEHDFGSLEWRGETVFWKIDYYDQAMERWEDPLSPKCRRVLTVMLACEY
jgi:Protein of unknown function (DUF3768)